MGRLVNVRVDEVRRGLWVAAAGRAGLSLSDWVRRCCDEAAALEGALVREREAREFVPSVLEEADARARIGMPSSYVPRSFRGPDPKPGGRR